MALALPSVMTVEVAGRQESLEIDPERGPLVYTATGETTFFELKNMNFGSCTAVQVPQKSWKDYTSTERKVIAHMAAKKNQSMRQWAEPKLAQAIAEREAWRKQQDQAEELQAAEEIRRMTPANRCEAERQRPPVFWRPISFEQVSDNCSKKAPGLFYGLEFPWSAKMLQDFGPDWLTLAFQRAGTLERTNRITRITINQTRITAGNNAGKFMFEVQYKNPREELHTKLFAKVPFAMTKETKQDRMSSSVLKQPMDFFEVNTYRLAESTLPMKTPKFYYGDISNDTSNFILITERIPFVGMDGRRQDQAVRPFEVEGPYDKCKDWQLRGDPKDYYTVIMQVSAKIAAADKTGRMGSPQLLAMSFGTPPAPTDKPEYWGVNPQAASGGPPAATLQKLKVAVEFFSDIAKAVFPPYATDEAFITKFTQTMMTLSAYTREIEFWKHMEPNYVALGHANLNVDNAYFWRDASGKLDCGVLDWGGFGASCVGHKVWWYLNCCEWEDIKKNLSHYVSAFVDTYREHGGPALDLGVMEMMAKITCLSNLAFMVAAVPDCLRQCPKQEWTTIADRHDPRISEDVGGKSTLRTTLRVMDNGLRMIEELGADQMLERWITEVWEGKMCRVRKTPEMVFG